MKISVFTILTISLFLLLPLQASHSDDTVYGWELMSEQERIQHRERMMSFKNEEAREAYRHEHHMRMEVRAKQKGIVLRDMQPRVGSSGDTMYGRQLMTEQERIQHREKMMSFKNEEERERYRQEHRMRMEERAEERKATYPDRSPPRGGGWREPGGGMGSGQGGGGRGR